MVACQKTDCKKPGNKKTENKNQGEKSMYLKKQGEKTHVTKYQVTNRGILGILLRSNWLYRLHRTNLSKFIGKTIAIPDFLQDFGKISDI